MGDLRVIAGSWRGRRIRVLDRPDLRPTSDRAREGLFNVIGPQIRGARVVDAFAGSGALGIEALSRGAEHVLFLETDRRAAEALEQLLVTLDAGKRAVVRRVDAIGWLTEQNAERWDWLLADPPYRSTAADALVASEALAAHIDHLVIEVDGQQKGSENSLKDAPFSHQRRLQYGRSCFDLYLPRRHS